MRLKNTKILRARIKDMEDIKELVDERLTKLNNWLKIAEAEESKPEVKEEPVVVPTATVV